MKVNVIKTIHDLDDNPIKTAPGSDENIILRNLLTNSILIPRQSDANILGDEKIRRFKLAQRIHDYDEVEFSAEEVVMLKSLVADTYPTLIVARICMLLDPAAI